VTVFGKEERLGGSLWQVVKTNPALQPAVQRDIQGILASKITHQAQAGIDPDLAAIQKEYRAVYTTRANAGSHPGIFVGEEYTQNGVSVVESAAHGRKAAMKIWQYLNRDKAQSLC
jgi:thioredoxin reductase